MSAEKENIDPKEATEAKLCAYLENELPPAERAEIEQHLAANPQHRQLLADLARTRDWMRTIPAESSPVDMAEIFQGQTERSMLLDESHDGSGGWMVHWPQFAMVAAVLVLFIGLGGLLFAMLKGPRGGAGASAGRTFSMTTSAGSATTLPTERMQNSPAVVSAKTVDLSGVPAAPSPVVVPPMPAAPGAISPVKAVASEADAPMAAAKSVKMPGGRLEAADAGSLKSEIEHLGYQLPVDQKTICFVVTADSPSGTIDQVRGFFQRHQLVFDDLTGGSPPSTTVIADAMRPAGAAASTRQAVALANDNATTGNGATLKPQIEQAQAANQNNNQNNGINADQRAVEAVPAVRPSTQPGGHAMYVAHGLSQLQVELLAASLATENLNQTVQRVTLSDEPTISPPTTLPIGAVSRGQTLTVTVAQLVGPGIDKTNAVKVADDGTISLPMMDPLVVAGLAPGEIERRIADKYRETNLIPQATVTVVNTTASTQPSAIAATMPTTQAVFATTQAAGTDVVVLIEKAAAVLPGK